MPLPPMPQKNIGDSIIAAALLGRDRIGKRRRLAKRRNQAGKVGFTVPAGG